MKCLDNEQIKIDLLIIFREHVKRVEDLEGHGLDRNGVLLIKNEMSALFKDINEYILDLDK